MEGEHTPTIIQLILSTDLSVIQLKDSHLKGCWQDYNLKLQVKSKPHQVVQELTGAKEIQSYNFHIIEKCVSNQVV